MATCTFGVATPDTGATPNTSGAFTPAVGDTLVVLCMATGTVDTAPTCTNSASLGISFVPGSQQLWSGGGQSIYAFISDGPVTSATSQTVTVDTPGDASTGTAIWVYRVAGIHKVGTAAVRQVKGNFGVLAVTPNVVFDAATLAGSPTLVVCCNTSTPPAITPPTSWTENAAGEIEFTSPQAGGAAAHRDSGHASATITWGAASGTAWGAIAVELDASTTEAPGVGTATLTGLAPAIAIDKTLSPGLGAIAVTGLAPLAVNDKPRPMLAGTLTVTGLAPAIAIDKLLAPGVGALAVAGLAPTLAIGSSAVTIAPGLGAATLSGLAPSMDKGIVPPVGALAITGLAPTIAVSDLQVIGVGVGSIAATGLAPTATVTVIGGGGGPGLLLALGLNLDDRVVVATPDQADLQITGLVPAWGATYSYTIPQGTVAVAGYVPTVTTAAGPQVPVLPAPPQLSVTGLAPAVFSGRPVRFTFDTDTQGFVGVGGPGTTTLWSSAQGNPAGSLRTVTTGFNRADDNTWTLTTDWQSLGVPANSFVTAISSCSADTRAQGITQGSGSFKPVLLTPTGIASIQIAPGRAFTVSESGWTQSASAETTGLNIPSAGSVTITGGSNVATTAVGTPNVQLVLDNIGFTISYYVAELVAPDAGSVAIAGYEPTVIGLATTLVIPPPASLSIQGAGPNISVQAPITGGGGGPGLLMAIALNLEQTPLGTAVLTITGYAPTIAHPFVLLGSDELVSGSASAVGTGIHTVVAQSPVYTPPKGTLAITGLAPTVVATEQHNIALPVTALTITRFVPTAGIDRVISPGTGQLAFNGLGVSINDNATISPGITSLAFAGQAPAILLSLTIPVPAGALTISGLAATPQSLVFVSPFAGVVTTAGYAPFVTGSDHRRITPDIAALTITGLAPTVGVSHLRQMQVTSLQIQSVGPDIEVPPDFAVVKGPQPAIAQVVGYEPLALLSVQIGTGVGSATFTGLAPTIEQSKPIAVGAGSVTITGYAPLIQLEHWLGTGDMQSQRATMLATASVIRHASGTLQSQQPLAFSGSGKHGHVAVGSLHSGPASMHGQILSVTAALQSGRATLKAHAKVKRFTPRHRPKPQRVNRYNVTLPPNKRQRVKPPNKRKPWK